MYQFQVEYTYEDYLALNRVCEKLKSRKQRIFRIVAIVLLADIIFAFVTFVVGAGEGLWWELPLFTLFSVIVSIKQTPGVNAKVWQLRSRPDIGEQSITLDEEWIEFRTQHEEARYFWSAVMNTYYHRGYYLLFLDKKQVIMLPERALVEGDPSALRAFLEEKLQQEVIDIG